MKATDFVAKAKKAANDTKTLYILGCFGAPMTATNKKRYISNYAYNTKRADMINAATSDTFGFDCVCLIKGILWGWDAKTDKQYGGAAYASNGVPDFGTESMKNYCTDWSKDFSKIEVGEVLWMSGHAGIYIGGGLAVECTPAWKNKVQITAVKNIGTKAGYNARTWTAHGKLKFVDYTVETKPEVKPEPTPEVKPTTTEFKVGDSVKITKAGNITSYGTGVKAGGIGWIRTIQKIYPGRAYPYQVGNNKGTTGFYKADALKKV